MASEPKTPTILLSAGPILILGASDAPYIADGIKSLEMQRQSWILRVTNVLMGKVDGLIMGSGRGHEMSKVEREGRSCSVLGLRM